MQNLIITDIKNGSDEFISIQKKLFENGIIWAGTTLNVLKDRLSVYNGDEDIILIIKNSQISWTNIGYGFSTLYNELTTLSGKDFLKV